MLVGGKRVVVLVAEPVATVAKNRVDIGTEVIGAGIPTKRHDDRYGDRRESANGSVRPHAAALRALWVAAMARKRTWMSQPSARVRPSM